MKELDQNECKLVNTYFNDSFSTVANTQEQVLYVLKSTYIRKENIIATFDINDICLIYDKSECDLFLQKHDGLEYESTEKQIKKRLFEIFANDLVEIANYKKREPGDDLDIAMRHLSNETKSKLIEGLKTLGVENIPIFRTRTLRQVKEILKRKMYYLIINGNIDRFEMTNSDFSKVIKNGFCGSWKSLFLTENTFFFYFDKTDALSYDKQFMESLRNDLESSPYEVANRLLRLEDDLSKGINKAIQLRTDKVGFVTIDKSLRYPKLDKIAEKLAKEIRNYHKSNSNKLTDDVLDTFKSIYGQINEQVQIAKTTIKELYAKVRKEEQCESLI